MKHFTLLTHKLVFSLVILLALTVSSKTYAQNQLGGHFGIVQPIVTLKDGDVNDEFSPYTVGFPIGITVRKNENFAFDAEFVPLITFGASQIINAEGMVSQELDNIVLLVHPGFLFKVGEGLTFGTRLAYELGASGRYGFTPLLNKGFKIGNVPAFVEFVLPVRGGSDNGGTVTAGIHVGVGF